MDTIERNREICQARRNGETFTTVASRFCLSRQRAHQIVLAEGKQPLIRARNYKGGIDRQPKQYPCNHCGALFIKSGGHQKRCDGCRLLCYPSGVLRVVPQSKVCIACGVIFESKQARRKTCSPRCWHILFQPYVPRRPQPEREAKCPTCGCTFYTTGFKRKYCKYDHRPSHHAPTPRPMAKSEVVFSKHYPDLIYLNQGSRLFKLNGCSYTPDFKDPKSSIYYEVAGTRQAYHANKHKYVEFRALYPGLTLKIVRRDGTEIELERRTRWTQ